ncbi:MAG TPA: DUF374 domain-containing protein [Planktothrix sp.]|jgi:hypothetical protein
MAKFRVRNLVAKFPLLDRLRIDFIAGFFYHGIGSLDRNYNIVKVYPDSIRPYVAGDKPAVFAMYHGRMVGFLQLIERRNHMRLLVSQSRDGEIIARALTGLGFEVARGSSGRGAVQGAKQLFKAARAGRSVVLMVDGPRGPALEVKNGAVRLAEISGLPIIPCVCSARHWTRMWGWDSFMCSHWGGPKNYLYGEPIEVPKHADEATLEACRQKLDASMTKLRALADSYWAVVA